MLKFDARHAPLYVTDASGTLTEQDCAEQARATKQMVAQSARYLTIFDASLLKTVGAKELRVLAKDVKENEPEMVKRCVLSAVVVDSAMIRGAFKAFLWLQPLPFPYSIHRTFAEALDAVERASAEERLAVDRAIATLRRERVR